MIVVQLFFTLFHHKGHHEIKEIIQDACHYKRRKRTLRRGNRLCGRKHLHHGNGKGKGGVLDEGDHLVGDGGKNVFPYLRKEDAKKTGPLSIAQDSSRFHLPAIHAFDPGAVNLRKIGRIIHDKADLYRKYTVGRMQADMKKIIRAVIDDKELQH